MIYNLRCSSDTITWDNGTEHKVSLDEAFMALEVNGYIQACCGKNYNISRVAYFTEDGKFKMSYDFETKTLKSELMNTVKLDNVLSVVPLNKEQGLILLTDYNTLVMCLPGGHSVELSAPYGITMIVMDIEDDTVKVVCKDMFDKKIVYKYNPETHKLEEI